VGTGTGFTVLCMGWIETEVFGEKIWGKKD
jgi:hypothetical protein